MVKTSWESLRSGPLGVMAGLAAGEKEMLKCGLKEVARFPPSLASSSPGGVVGMVSWDSWLASRQILDCTSRSRFDHFLTNRLAVKSDPSFDHF